jgi:hypothetical protein
MWTGKQVVVAVLATIAIVFAGFWLFLVVGMIGFTF